MGKAHPPVKFVEHVWQPPFLALSQLIQSGDRLILSETDIKRLFTDSPVDMIRKVIRSMQRVGSSMIAYGGMLGGFFRRPYAPYHPILIPAVGYDEIVGTVYWLSQHLRIHGFVHGYLDLRNLFVFAGLPLPGPEVYSSCDLNPFIGETAEFDIVDELLGRE